MNRHLSRHATGRFKAAASSALLATTPLVTAAHAQETVAPPASLDFIVVTGEKTERSLQDTATSVRVITAEHIEAETLVNLGDVLQRTANVSTSGTYGFTIRGIDSQNVSGTGVGGLASIYVDGAVMPRRGVENGPLTMWDLAQVEVLRGPQSTLQGRNSLAGAIILRSQDPTYHYTGKARVLVQEGDQQGYAAAVGGPLVADQLAFRFAMENRSGDGWVYNTTRDEESAPYDTTTLRGKLLFEPAGVDGLCMLLTYLHEEHRRGERRSYTGVEDYWSNRQMFADALTVQETNNDILTLEASYAVSPAITLTGVASYNDIRFFTEYDLDQTEEPLSYGHFIDDTETFTQELRANFDFGRLTGLAGLYHSRIETDWNGYSLSLVRLPQETITSILVGSFGLDPAVAATAVDLYSQAVPNIPVEYSYITPSIVKTYALFTDATYDVTDRLSLHGGFRVDREHYTMANDQTTIFAGTYPDPALYGPLAPAIAGITMLVDMQVGQANSSTPLNTTRFSAFLPKAGLTYRWTDDISTGLMAQRGYRSGGSAVNTARSSVVPYDQEYTWNYEFSLRTAWLDRRLTVNANAFYIDWTDQQVTVNLGLNDYDTQTENAGSSYLWGAELELSHMMTEQLNYYLSLGHVRTKFKDFTFSTGEDAVDLSGAEFAFAPRWTASAGVNYQWTNGLHANVNANYRSAAYDFTNNQEQEERAIDARLLVNAKFGWQGEPFGAYVMASNLFNTKYIERSGYGRPWMTLGEPQVFGIGIEARY